MINQIRTLLLNHTPNGTAADYPGEEFIDPLFRPRILPAQVQAALSTLFGYMPDRLQLNYRMRQIMELLHGTELVDYVYAADNRVTYYPFSQDFFSDVFVTNIVQQAGPASSLNITGTHQADEVAGLTEWRWVITITSTDIIINQQYPHSNIITTPLTFTDGLSQPVRLGDSNFYLEVPYPSSTVVWNILSRQQPALDITVLLGMLPPVLGDYLNTIMSNPDPAVQVFRNVYNTNPFAIYKYSALLLALAYYIDTLPQAN